MSLALLAIAIRSYSVAHESPLRFSQVQIPPFVFYRAQLRWARVWLTPLRCFAAGLESKSVFYVENGPRAVPGVSQSSEVCILRQVLKTPLCEVFVHFPMISQLHVAKPHQPWW